MKTFILLLMFLSCSFPKLAHSEDQIDLADQVELQHSESPQSKILNIQFKNGTAFTLPDVPLTEDQKKLYSQLDDSAKKAFHTNREWYLKSLAGIMRLGYPLYKAGGPVAKSLKPLTDQVSSVYQLEKEKLKERVLKLAGEKFQDVFNQAETEEERKEANLFLQLPTDGNLDKKERYRRIVQNTLRSIDQEMWNHSTLLSSANEGFVVFQLGAGGGLAIGDTNSCQGAVGCASMNVGLAVNAKEKRLSLFYFNDVDTLKKVVGIYAGANAFGSVEFGLGHHDHRLPLLSEKGVSVVPPGPFLGVFTPSTMQFGAGLGPTIAGINLPVPSFLVSNLERFPLFRVSVAATWPFFKVQFGAKPALELAKLGARAVAVSTKAIVGGCRYVFSKVRGEKP